MQRKTHTLILMTALASAGFVTHAQAQGAFDIIQRIHTTDACMDLAGTETKLVSCANRQNPTRWGAIGSPNSKWVRLAPAYDGTKCLTAGAGNKPVLSSCRESGGAGGTEVVTEQRWELSKAGQIISGRGTCLTSLGGNPVMAPCAGGPTQTWLASDQYIQQEARNAQKAAAAPAPVKDIEIRTPRAAIVAMSSTDGTALCIGGSRKAGAQVELVSCDHAYLFVAPNNSIELNRYELFDTKPTGLCLDVRGGNAQQGTPVQLYACNSSPAQKWFQADQAADVLLGKTVSRLSSNVALNLCLDAPGGQKKGAKLVTWACHLSATQQNFRVSMGQ